MLHCVQVTDAPVAIVRSSVRPSENVRVTTMIYIADLSTRRPSHVMGICQLNLKFKSSLGLFSVLLVSATSTSFNMSF
jgi:hypothetical protein